MKKVLMVSCEGLGNGGVQHVMMDIVRNLHTEFYFDMLLFTNDIRHFDAEFQTYGTIFRLPHYNGNKKWKKRLDYFLRFNRIYRGVKQILQQHGPYQVIHCNNYFEAAPCLLAAKWGGVPVRIAHSHNTTSPAKYAWWKKTAFDVYNACARFLINRLATVCLGCSRQACIDFFGSKSPARVVYNSVDLTRFDTKQHTPYTGKRFIHIGRFSYQKNQEFVIDTFAHLHKQCLDCHLTLVGMGNVTPIQQRIEHYGLQQNITIVDGKGADIPQLYANADYMIFPSRFEGFGIVLIEAQAMGLPCFVSQAVQPESDVGLLIHLDLQAGPKYWADAIMAYIKQHPYTQTASTTRLAQYDVKKICKQYARIYRGEQ